MVKTRSGHSLPELLVALVFLGVSVAAVSATAVLGARWTADAAARQEAVRLAARVLDSLAASPAPTAGALDAPGLRAEWWVDTASDPAGLRVEVRSPAAGVTWSVLHGVHHPAVLVLPDNGPLPPSVP